MEKFSVVFYFAGGEKKTFESYEAKSYNDVASQVMESSNGWFGLKGDIVNLANVLRCEIHELDKNGFMKWD